MRYFSNLIIVLIVSGCADDNRQQSSNGDIEQARMGFHELNEAIGDEDGKTWNHSLRGPVMMVNRDTKNFVANENGKSKSFIEMDGLFIGTLPEDVNIANTAFDWEGKRWTMVALPLPSTKSGRLNLLFHESFHRIQHYIGFDSLTEIQNNHLDEKDGRIYLKLELEALKLALNCENPTVHLKNALLFRNYRHSIFPNAKASENSLEINEGLAEYTGSTLSQRSDSALKAHFISRINDLYSMPSFVRSFAYFTIPLYGFFIRQSNEFWNLEITKDSNLTDYISRYFGFKLIDTIGKEHVENIGKLYGMDSIVNVESQDELMNERKKEEYRKVFLVEKILRIELINMKIGFNPSNIVPLDTSGTVYPNLRITDNWGVLDVDSLGALLGPKGKFVNISFPSFISDTIISGKGWRLKLNEHRKLKEIENGYILYEE